MIAAQENINCNNNNNNNINSSGKNLVFSINNLINESLIKEKNSFNSNNRRLPSIPVSLNNKINMNDYETDEEIESSELDVHETNRTDLFMKVTNPVSNGSIHLCKDCLRTFKDINNYKEHRFQEHQATEFPNVRKCSMCSYATLLKSKYDCHMRCHLNNKVIKCHRCDYSTINIRHMSRHERMHMISSTNSSTKRLSPFSSSISSSSTTENYKIDTSPKKHKNNDSMENENSFKKSKLNKKRKLSSDSVSSRSDRNVDMTKLSESVKIEKDNKPEINDSNRQWRPQHIDLNNNELEAKKFKKTKNIENAQTNSNNNESNNNVLSIKHSSKIEYNHSEFTSITPPSSSSSSSSPSSSSSSSSSSSLNSSPNTKKSINNSNNELTSDIQQINLHPNDSMSKVNELINDSNNVLNNYNKLTNMNLFSLLLQQQQQQQQQQNQHQHTQQQFFPASLYTSPLFYSLITNDLNSSNNDKINSDSSNQIDASNYLKNINQLYEIENKNTDCNNFICKHKLELESLRRNIYKLLIYLIPHVIKLFNFDIKTIENTNQMDKLTDYLINNTHHLNLNTRAT